MRITTLLVAAALAAPAVPSALAGEGPGSGSNPPYEADAGDLDSSLHCSFVLDAYEPAGGNAHEPVLLVHGTFTAGREQYGWNYELLLADEALDFCTVTYPDRGLGDQQESAEYVAHAIVTMAEATGRKVDVVGHSQGAVLPRWAVKFWAAARANVDDLVMLAGPNHGTSINQRSDQSPFEMPEAFYQFDPDSDFVTALNDGDETPGNHISYSSIYSEMDEVVQPAFPTPTAGLDWGHEDENTVNLSVQSVCRGRVVDHLTIGTTDRATQELVLDALTGDGPVDPARLALGATCSLPDQYGTPQQFAAFRDQFQRTFGEGFFGPDRWHMADQEPELKPYAR